MGGTHFLPTRIGVARARHLALTGEAIDAERAVHSGLIAEVVDDDQLQARAQALAAQLADGPTQAFIAVRNLMNSGSAHTLEQQLELEAAAQQRLGGTADFAEGLAAFRDKRAPRFAGR
jgi:2-(1,2-epoxy-1,2-dihydrophenyl)acetyl-CoA isomerase